MRATMFLFVALVIVGCQPATKPTVNGDTSMEELSKLAANTSGEIIFSNFVAAMAGETNADIILARYAVSADAGTVLSLSFESTAELHRKLNTLARKTNFHPYTQSQIERALKLKSERKAEKASQ